jgi:hypothetical protein
VSLFPALEGQHALLGRQRHLVGRKARARDADLEAVLVETLDVIGG